MEPHSRLASLTSGEFAHVLAVGKPAASILKELQRLGESALWQLGSGALLAVVACIIIVLTKLAGWAVQLAKESLFITFVVDKQNEAHLWLTHYLAKRVGQGTRKELFDPQRDYDSDEDDYCDDTDDDDEVDAFDEDLLAGAGPVGGVLLNARGGKSKRLMSRVIPGERQTLRVEGRRVWVQRQPAPPEEEDDGSGQRRNNGRNSRRRRNGGAAEEGSTIPKGAFKITVSRRQGVETFGALLASARAGFLASRRGKLLTYEAVTVNDDGTYGESPEDDWSDLCWDDDGAGGAGGGFVSMLGMSRAPPQLVWHSAPSFRAVSPGQVILPHGHESAVASLIRDVSTFLDSSGWYAQRGIPFRRGYIVHGPAGCGKSMVTAAVATELKLTVYCVDLARPGLSDEWLASLLSSVNPRSVIVFERVDKAFDAKRRRVADPRRGGRRGSSAALTFSGLLNALDGVCAFEGSITVFTSELPPDQLDEALTRPGRCDYAMHVPQATPAAAAQLFSRFFSSHPRFRPTGEGELEAMSREFEAALERRQQQGQPGVKPFSMRDVVSFVCTRSPRQAVAEVDALGIDAAEAAARSLVAKRQQGLGAVAELLPPAALGEEAAAGAREVAG